jgi:hypothetical protein
MASNLFNCFDEAVRPVRFTGTVMVDGKFHRIATDGYGMVSHSDGTAAVRDTIPNGLDSAKRILELRDSDALLERLTNVTDLTDWLDMRTGDAKDCAKCSGFGVLEAMCSDCEERHEHRCKECRGTGLAEQRVPVRVHNVVVDARGLHRILAGICAIGPADLRGNGETLFVCADGWRVVVASLNGFEGNPAIPQWSARSAAKNARKAS